MNIRILLITLVASVDGKKISRETITTEKAVTLTSPTNDFTCRFRRQFTLLLLLMILLSFSTQGMAEMFWILKRYDVHLSPEVHGQIMRHGEPQSGVPVFRSLTYGKEKIEKTTTDANGEFYFQENWIRSRIPGRLFDETRNRQIIYAEAGGEKFLLWYAVTDSIEPELVVKNKLKSMQCDLNSPKKLQHFVMHEHPSFTHDIFSICRWEE